MKGMGKWDCKSGGGVEDDDVPMQVGWGEGMMMVTKQGSIEVDDD